MCAVNMVGTSESMRNLNNMYMYKFTTNMQQENIHEHFVPFNRDRVIGGVISYLKNKRVSSYWNWSHKH